MLMIDIHEFKKNRVVFWNWWKIMLMNWYYWKWMMASAVFMN